MIHRIGLMLVMVAFAHLASLSFGQMSPEEAESRLVAREAAATQPSGLTVAQVQILEAKVADLQVLKAKIAKLEKENNSLLAEIATGSLPKIQPGTRPSNPVIMGTEVGSTASFDVGKITVTFAVQIDRTGMKEEIAIDNKLADDLILSRDRQMSFPIETFDDVASKLDAAVDAATNGKDMNDTIAGVAIGSASYKGQQVVTLLNVEQKSYDDLTIYMTPDNAALLSKLIRKAGNVSDWLQPTINGLAKGMASKG